MADLYRVVYESKRGQNNKSVVVSATTIANAIAAASTADPDFKQHVTATVKEHNIIAGS